MQQASIAEQISFEPLAKQHFTDVITLGNLVHGDGYLDPETMEKIYQMSFSQGINASFVAYHHQQLVGFRLTYAANQWQVDQWCTPQDWGHEIDKVCYFKCNTVAEQYRGCGIGAKLLAMSIAKAKQQGCTAGLAHIWLQSPGNSAFRYMSRAGGTVIKRHPDRWYHDSVYNGYNCVFCGHSCHCEAAEMLVDFAQQ